jgi:hypothetical protein
MNAKFLLVTVAAIAAAGVNVAARADEADASQFALKFQGDRTRAEVMTEAARVPATRSQEPNGSRVLVVPASTVSMQTVRAEAAQALRLGKIPSGEASF